MKDYDKRINCSNRLLIAASILLFLLTIAQWVNAQNVGINSNGATPDGSALLDINGNPANDKGFLMPRVTTAERDNNITSPAVGLMVYNLDCNVINYYNGTVWVPIGNTGSVASPGAITGNTTPAENATGETYSITAVTGATGYNWTVPSGATITAGQGTTGITVDFGTTDGNVCVTANNACGISNTSCQAITLTTTCFDGTTAIVTVTGAGGAVWMDRNLGATQAAFSSTDAAAYGAAAYDAADAPAPARAGQPGRTDAASWR